MNWILDHSAYGLAILALIAAGVVLRLFGWRAAVAVLLAALPLVAYRRGRDVQRVSDAEAIRTAELQSTEMIHDEEQGALAAGRAAAERVRARATGIAAGNDKG